MRGCGTVFVLSQSDKETIEDIRRLAERYERIADLLKATAVKCLEENTIEGIDIMVAYAFNSQQYTPQYGGGSGGLPAGPNGENVKYKVVIVNSTQENVEKNGQVTGGYLALELVVIEGPLSNQKHTDRLNLHNTNPKVVEIANKQLSAYCHVLNKFAFQDTAELHNIPFWVEIGLQKEPNPNGYTEVKAIFDINGNTPDKAGSGPAPAANAAPPAFPPAGVAPTAAAPAPAAWGQAAPAPSVDNNVGFPSPGNAPAAPSAAPAPAAWGQPAPSAAPPGWGPR